MLGTTIKPNFDGCVICNSEDFESIKLFCESCENCVHIDCVGEKPGNLKHVIGEEENLEVTWTCRVCSIQNSLNKNVEKDGTQLPEIDFRPECCVCKLQGSIMCPTTSFDHRVKRPSGPSFQVSPTITISELLKKEFEYQKCLAREKLKSPEVTYTPTLVNWIHLSCAFWLPQITIERGKPIHYKPTAQQSNGACQICHSLEGMMFQCCYDTKTFDDEWEPFVDFQKKNHSCGVMMHVECARRADFQMTYSAAIEKYQVYCYEHGPYQTDLDRY